MGLPASDNRMLSGPLPDEPAAQHGHWARTSSVVEVVLSSAWAIRDRSYWGIDCGRLGQGALLFLSLSLLFAWETPAGGWVKVRSFFF